MHGSCRVGEFMGGFRRRQKCFNTSARFVDFISKSVICMNERKMLRLSQVNLFDVFMSAAFLKISERFAYWKNISYRIRQSFFAFSLFF